MQTGNIFAAEDGGRRAFLGARLWQPFFRQPFYCSRAESQDRVGLGPKIRSSML